MSFQLSGSDTTRTSNMYHSQDIKGESIHKAQAGDVKLTKVTECQPPTSRHLLFDKLSFLFSALRFCAKKLIPAQKIRVVNNDDANGAEKQPCWWRCVGMNEDFQVTEGEIRDEQESSISEQDDELDTDAEGKKENTFSEMGGGW